MSSNPYDPNADLDDPLPASAHQDPTAAPAESQAPPVAPPNPAEGLEDALPPPGQPPNPAEGLEDALPPPGQPPSGGPSGPRPVQVPQVAVPTPPPPRPVHVHSFRVEDPNPPIRYKVLAVVAAVALVVAGYRFFSGPPTIHGEEVWSALEAALNETTCSRPYSAETHLELLFDQGQVWVFDGDGKLPQPDLECLESHLTTLGAEISTGDSVLIARTPTLISTNGKVVLKSAGRNMSQLFAKSLVGAHYATAEQSDINKALEEFESRQDEVWRCWVQHGIIRQTRVPQFGTWSSNNLGRSPTSEYMDKFGFSMNGFGTIDGVKSGDPRDTGFGWQDTKEYKRCLQDIAEQLPWPALPNEQSYKVGFRFTYAVTRL